MSRVFSISRSAVHRRRRLVAAVLVGVCVIAAVGTISLGASIVAHGTAWDAYRTAQIQVTTAQQNRDTAAATFEKARTAALTTFQTAQALHEKSTAHGVLLTAASAVSELGTTLTTLSATAGIAVDSQGSVSIAPASFTSQATASPTLDSSSDTAALSAAAAALKAEIERAQSEATELTTKTTAVTMATAALQKAAEAAATAQHLPLTGQPAGEDPHCSAMPSGTRTVFVSIADQHLWACEGSHLFLDTAVTTGASAITNVDDKTPTGTFHILGKTQNTVLRGSDVNGSWNDPVHYWVPFLNGIGFHDASWQTFPFGSAQYTSDGSHGCVHTPPRHADEDVQLAAYRRPRRRQLSQPQLRLRAEPCESHPRGHRGA